MKIKTKIILNNVSASFFLVVLVIVINFLMVSLTNQYNEIEKLLDKRYFLQKAETDHLIWVNELSNAIFLKHEFSGQINHTLCNFGKWYYKQSINNRTEHDLFILFEEPHKNLHNSGKKIKQFLHEQKFKEAIEEFRNVTIKILDSVKSLLRKYRDFVNKKTLLVRESTMKKAQFIKSLVIVMGLIVVIIALVFAIIIIVSIARPLNAMKVMIKDISEGEGDLTKRLPEKGKTDELDIISKYLNQFIASIENIVIEIKNISQGLTTSIGEVTTNAQNLSEIAQSQSATVEETSSSITELSANTASVAKNADNARNMSDKLYSIAKQNQEMLFNAIESMNKINDNSQKIFEILGIINDISDQTNLLALNAAIEAARAGEHGRGFSVVADEISKLAEKSSSNSKEIEKLIKQNIKDVESGNKIIKETGEDFKHIIENAGNTSKLMNEIAASIEQQQAGTSDIEKAAENINDVTQNVSASSEELSASSEEIHSSSEMLLNIVKRFIVNESNKSG